MLAIVWVSCAVDPDDFAPGGTVPTVLEPLPPPPLSIAAATAFDPLRAPWSFTVHGPPDAVVTVGLPAGKTDPPQEIVLSADGAATGTWDGRLDGAWAAPGAYTVAVHTADEAASASVALVRTGFIAAWLDGDAGVTAAREPIYWPADGWVAAGEEPVAVLAAIDDGKAPLDFPAVADGILSLRPTDAEPAAFHFDSRPILSLDLPPDTGLELADVGLAVEGWTVLSGVPLRPGTPVVLQRDEPLGETIGRSELDLALTLQVDGQALGAQHLPLTIYRMLDASQFNPVAARYHAWAPVLEEALTALEGTAPDDVSVADAVVDFVYHDLGLEYDTVAGASAYTTYDGFDFEDPHFQLGDFLVRRFGNVINCSDAANIVGAYANMVGVPLDHLILDPNFDLNFIQAIGETEFTSCPFGGGGCGFSYHAVTTIGVDRQIWDATLALDGDADPGTLPATQLLVQHVDGAEYHDRLVRSGNPTFNNQARETLQ